MANDVVDVLGGTAVGLATRYGADSVRGEARTVCAIVHFPVDGADERDQHVLTRSTHGGSEPGRWSGSPGREA